MSLTSLKLPVNLALSSGVWNTARISLPPPDCASLAIAAVATNGQAGNRGRRRGLVCASSWESPLLQLLRAVADLERWLDLSNRCISRQKGA